MSLVVSSGSAKAGDLVTVGRTDHHAMDFGALMLFGDADAGCRMFSLSLNGTGPTWIEVTDETEFGTVSMVSPAARTEEYRVPEVAAHGTYLLCAEDYQAPTVCAEITI